MGVRAILLTVIFCQLLSAGCTTATSTVTTTSTASSGTTTTTAAGPVSLANDIQPIFNSNCTSCHPSSGGLNLNSGSSYSNLANVTSQGYAPTLRVKPSDEANSVLVKKIEGASGYGGRMPPGSGALTSADIQKIKDWINQGALNN